MRPGEHGRIAETSRDGKHFATTYARDKNGVRRRVERSSAKSAEDARRLLQRHLRTWTAPVEDALLDGKTVLTDVFEMWIRAKSDEDGVSQQTIDQYRQVWRKHGADRFGELRLTEIGTREIHQHLQSMGATVQGKRLRMILRGMFSMAVRFGALTVNPVTEARPAKTERKATRALKVDELARVRAAVRAYADREGPGPKPGKLLPPFVDMLLATGARPNEVLATRWCDVDLDADPPTLTITGTVIDHGRVEGMAVHRQEKRKGGSPEHSVLLPRLGVDCLIAMRSKSSEDGDSPVFANRDGGWMSLANLRRALRAALPEDLVWVTPHSFRRTVATAVRDALGPDKAQQQLSHSKLSTTETHYLQRHTRGPDVRQVLDEFVGESSGKVSDSAV